MIGRAPHKEMDRNLPPFSCQLLLEMFPFAFLFNPTMTIFGCGEKLVEVAGGKEMLLGQPLSQYFKLRRPKGISFSWKNVSIFIPFNALKFYYALAKLNEGEINLENVYFICEISMKILSNRELRTNGFANG